ncbi:MAG TPA: adenylate/guanylate cyclase domain-containing protein [Dehalococcoidia bacterium]|nr:adenylate/guanylate cyclase domain-containing protein [Dehalococcoidia bacterium]
MEPRIQYATTADGVSIAFCIFGDGIPAIGVPPLPWTHLEAELADPDYRAWDERISHGLTYARYDSRGSGLSDRDVSDFSLNALMLDIDAVAARAGFERFVVVGISVGSPLAIAYAARRPEAVSHLVLWCPFARAWETAAEDEAGIAALRGTNWEMFTQTIAHAMVVGWDSGAQASRFARLMQEAVSPEAADSIQGQITSQDVSADLPNIRCPTLVIHRKGTKLPPPEVGRGVAARIPNSELVLLEGESLLPYVGEMEAVTRAIDGFLGIALPEATFAATTPAPGASLATILFTDVEDSTALTQRLGDTAARDVMREHERITREALRVHGGSEVKTLGDGFMASFGSATGALECAIAIQRAFASPSARARFKPAPDEGPAVAPVRVRIGLNAGEPIAEGDDLHGTAVITAARIAALAQGGEILVSDVVRQLVAGKGFLFNDRGDHALKGFEDPVRVYEVHWQGTA